MCDEYHAHYGLNHFRVCAHLEKPGLDTGTDDVKADVVPFGAWYLEAGFGGVVCFTVVLGYLVVCLREAEECHLLGEGGVVQCLCELDTAACGHYLRYRE